MIISLAVVTWLAVFGWTRAQDELCICLEEVTSVRDSQSPLIIEHAGDGTNRRFIGEQTGLCWIVLPDGSRLPEPFLNITELVYQASGYSEEGFLSLAFHPQFSTNRRLYVYYTYRVDGQPISRLTELLTNASNPDKVDNTTARHLLTIPQPYTNHNGGRLMFGLDGYLYLGLGDGGSAGDPSNNAQNLQTLLGKTLRIDVDTRTDSKEYGIPPDNPYAGSTTALEEIYAIGFRNPWRIHQDTGDRDTGYGRGRIFIGDVGQNTWEEVDILVVPDNAASNYGWSGYEAHMCYDAARCAALENTTLIWPIHSYDHFNTGICVIGGPVYRGVQYPNFNGLYFFGDWSVTGKLFYLEESAGNWTSHMFASCSGGVCTTGCEAATCASDGLTNTFNQPYILTFGVDEQGEVYFGASASQLTSSRSGAVYKFHDRRSLKK